MPCAYVTPKSITLYDPKLGSVQTILLHEFRRAAFGVRDSNHTHECDVRRVARWENEKFMQGVKFRDTDAHGRTGLVLKYSTSEKNLFECQ